MGHVNYTLKPATIDNAKPRDKSYALTDGGGLQLEVLPSGSKTWRFKYHLNGKREKVTIGSYPAFTIKQARDRHEELRALVERGQSPAKAMRALSTEQKLADGDAVRAAAACRSMGVAQLVRRALVMSLDLRATATVSPVNGGSDGQTPDQIPIRDTAKLTLRLTRAHADALMLNAGALGLSYGDYVGRPLAGSRLPHPVVERQADRTALLASNDRMAALSTDLVALVTLLRQAKVEQARPYRERLETVDAEIRRHLDRASALIERL